MRWALLAVAVVVAAAVAIATREGRNPANDFIPAGTAAVIGGGAGAPLDDPGGEYQAYPLLRPGVRVTVRLDPAGGGRAQEIGEQGPMRPVSVTVEDGEFRGKTGKVAREHLLVASP